MSASLILVPLRRLFSQPVANDHGQKHESHRRGVEETLADNCADWEKDVGSWDLRGKRGSMFFSFRDLSCRQ